MIFSDNQIFGKGLSKLLQQSDQHIKVKAIGPMTSRSLTLLERHQPDLIVFNIFSQEIEIPKLLSVILNTYPEINVLVITLYQDPFYIRKLKTLDIKGCICNDISTRQLINVIQAVSTGKFFFDNKLTEEKYYKKESTAYNDEKQSIARKARLSKRELEVLKLTLDGYNSRLVAEKLSISVRTVQNHRAHIM